MYNSIDKSINYYISDKIKITNDIFYDDIFSFVMPSIIVLLTELCFKHRQNNIFVGGLLFSDIAFNFISVRDYRVVITNSTVLVRRILKNPFSHYILIKEKKKKSVFNNSTCCKYFSPTFIYIKAKKV
jgi:hypothetical protein